MKPYVFLWIADPHEEDIGLHYFSDIMGTATKPEEKLFEIVRKLMLYHPDKKAYRPNKYTGHQKLMEAIQKHGEVHTFEGPLDPTGFHFAIEGHKG